MNGFLLWLEATSFSTWMRESPSVFAFPAILSCHTVGMGLVAGINAALGLRILGVGKSIPLREMKRFFPVMWFGFWLNAVSGVALLIAYPTKALTNPVFYLKLALIAIAVLLIKPIARRALVDPPEAPLALDVAAVEAAVDGRQRVAATQAGLRTGSSPETTFVASSTLKMLAAASIVCWFSAITAGRLLAYTYSRLMATF
jgi:hypothetical protein